MDPIAYPRPLVKGDTIAIISPASIIDPALVYGAKQRLEEQGYVVRIMPHALGHSGSYSGTAAGRFEDFATAYIDPAVRAILCSRGGYGCVHLLEAASRLDLNGDPKWIIGFSDVSALHALMASKGIVSIHGSMAKSLANHDERFTPNSMLLSILRGEPCPLRFHSDRMNHHGIATGRLTGGNLAVLQALIGTPFDILDKGGILFIEDIAEPIYKVERILCQLHLSGRLHKLSGLVVGEFTEYRADSNYKKIEDMIAPLVSDIGCPVAFHAPIGHIDGNTPVIHGANARLCVTAGSVSIDYIQD